MANNNSIFFVAILIFLVIISVQTCQHTTVENVQIKQTQAQQRDTIKALHQAAQNQQQQIANAENVNNTVAKVNEVLKDSISNLQEQTQAVQTPVQTDDAGEWKRKAIALQRMNDSLTDYLLSALQTKMPDKQMPGAADSIKKWPAAQPYFLGFTKPYVNGLATQITLQGATTYNYVTRSFSIGGVLRFYKGHTSLNWGNYWNITQKRYNGVISVNEDIGSIKFKNKKR